MNLYLSQISQLVDLQRVDDAIFLVRQELKQAPQEVEALTRQFKGLEDQKNRILDKLQHLTEQQKRLDGDIEDDTVRLKKSKTKLMQVGNTREYQAMMREMDTMEKQNHSREEERSVLHEELAYQQAQLAEAEAAWTSAREELTEKEANLEKRLQEANIKLADLEKTRSNTGSEVPAPVLARYEFIRRRLEHPVIVPVENGICSGCHIAIPPQTFIELQRGQQILSCPNCQRLMFWTEHFHVPGEEKTEE